MILSRTTRKNSQAVLFVTLSIAINACKQEPFSGDAKNFCNEPIVRAIVDRVRKEYVEVPDEHKMAQGALAGMLGALDPYSTYMDEKIYQNFVDFTKGNFGGIGVEVAFVEAGLKIISPMDESPAQKAGLLAGDIVTHVNKKDISSLPHGEVIDMIHGKPNTSVTLTISREGEANPLNIIMTREIINVNPIKYTMIKGTGYIRIAYFSEVTANKLAEAMKDLRTNKTLKNVIIDLRNNPGGTLEQAIAVCNHFLERGIIVRVRGRNPENNKVFEANGKDLLKGIPLAVLINEGSASASEIVSAALKENDRAQVLGTKSYGKGSVQGVFRIPNMGAVKLTIARFYTPKNNEIQEKGVTPHRLITVPRAEFLAWMARQAEKKITLPWDAYLREDIQLQKAIASLDATVTSTEASRDQAS